MCVRSAWHPLHQMFTNRKKSGVYSKLSAVFGEFWKVTIVGPSSSSFSAEFVHGGDDKPDLTHTCAHFYF